MSQSYARGSYVRGRSQPRIRPGIFGLDTNINATSRQGTVITGGAANTKGDYTALIASTSNDIYSLWVDFSNVAGSGTAGNALVDIATGDAGSESIVIENINAGSSAGSGAPSFPRIYHFRGIYIPAGTRIAARCQGNQAAETITVQLHCDGTVRWGTQTTYVTYGADTTDSGGTPVTPVVGSFGNWTEIGTTSRDHLFWCVGFDIQNITLATLNTVTLQIGYGPDSSNVTAIGGAIGLYAGNETVGSLWPPVMPAASVPSGTKVWARIQSSATTTALGVIIYGC
jgi:hypothetical protein